MYMQVSYVLVADGATEPRRYYIPQCQYYSAQSWEDTHVWREVRNEPLLVYMSINNRFEEQLAVTVICEVISELSRRQNQYW